MASVSKWLLILLLLGGCATPTQHWVWQHTNGAGQDQLSAAIDTCEEVAQIEKADDGFDLFDLSARPRGGWGDFDFEQCMRKRGWKLVLEPLPGARQQQRNE